MQPPILLELPEQLETSRLVMRVPRPGDGVQLFGAVSEALPELRRFLAFLPWVAADQSVEASEVYCRTAYSNFVARRDIPFLLVERETSVLVGCAGLHRPDWGIPKVEVGYWCRPSAMGRGFISEGVSALVTLAFAQLSAVRVELVTDEANMPSRKVAERCGFVLEGVMRNVHRAPDGTLRHNCMYAQTSGAE
jgi:RimJ/RimL family protein N-acetyltransferase